MQNTRNEKLHLATLIRLAKYAKLKTTLNRHLTTSIGSTEYAKLKTRLTFAPSNFNRVRKSKEMVSISFLSALGLQYDDGYEKKLKNTLHRSLTTLGCAKICDIEKDLTSEPSNFDRLRKLKKDLHLHPATSTGCVKIRGWFPLVFYLLWFSNMMTGTSLEICECPVELHQREPFELCQGSFEQVSKDTTN